MNKNQNKGDIIYFALVQRHRKKIKVLMKRSQAQQLKRFGVRVYALKSNLLACHK